MKNLFSAGNKQFTFILITMFLGALGFSIIIPILPFLISQYISGQNQIAFFVGALLSVYALCSFIAAPGLGALSDKYGRRPILLISLFGSVIGYLLLGIGGALWILFLGRIIDGLTGGNISTIYAYVADITKPQDRGKYYGMLGAAWGVGFMFGPALGGLFSHISISAPLFLAAGITFLNMLWGYFVLPESLQPEHTTKHVAIAHLNPFAQFSHVLSVPSLQKLFTAGFFFFLAFNASYGNNSVFWKDVFSWGPTQIGLLLFFVGVLDIFSQGFLVRKLLPIVGEAKLAIGGTMLSIVGFAVLALTSVIVSPLLLIAGVTILNIGDGLFEPSASGLISNAVGPQMQGRVQGANQGMQSIARVLGPLGAAWLYQYAKGLPYAVEAALTLGTLCVLLMSFQTITTRTTEAAAA